MPRWPRLTQELVLSTDTLVIGFFHVNLHSLENARVQDRCLFKAFFDTGGES